jgi:hypothetical protein
MKSSNTIAKKAKTKESQAKSERGFRPSLHMKSRVTQAIKSQKSSKIKQSQGESERGFRLSPRMRSSNTIAKKTHKSSKVKPSLNEVLSFAQAQS